MFKISEISKIFERFERFKRFEILGIFEILEISGRSRMSGIFEMSPKTNDARPNCKERPSMQACEGVNALMKQ